MKSEVVNLNKHKKSPSILLFVLVGLILLLTSCQEITSSQAQDKYQIVNVEPEKRYIDFGKNTRIFFEVINNAETTLVSRIETKINNSCFSIVEDKGLDGIPPGQKTSSYVYINSQSGDYGYKENCKGEAFKVSLILKDISGKILAVGETEVSIPK